MNDKIRESASPETSVKACHSVAEFDAVMPRWTPLKKWLALPSLSILVAVAAVRIGVSFAGRGAEALSSLGFKWIETANGNFWSWPESAFLHSTVGWDLILDMLGGMAGAVLLSVLYCMALTRESSARRQIWRALRAACLAAILVYTYHWCRIDPFEVWHSKGNAWTHLMGCSFTQEERDSIKADAERAPEYFAEGEANYIVSQKYLSVPQDKVPSPYERQVEIDEAKKGILAKMSLEQRKRIVDDEYERLIDKKRGGYWPPEMAPAKLLTYLKALLETIAIAIWASLLSVICAVPISMFATRSTLMLMLPGDSLWQRAARWISVFVVRRFLDSCRGFNELVMALIFVSVIGLGPFAGILALWVHTTGVLGKVFSEAIDAIEVGQVEALVSSGARPTQAISFSVLPQVMPIFISYSLLRFESNVRSAAILGWVGAGGIGFLLQDKMVGYSYREVCSMMIMIIVAVSLIDFLCGKLRRRFI